ncbi:NADPH-dependent FMN reductase [Pseudanabaena sp. PCC 6802]|uniref:NADPH-dependent FMN reductase n=1 Tax=Pseudanabaena sp. PCC 6802 TaxID=118173 RepID=UPI0003487AEB|nr:NADPH-dependent FMN reductase [Pseudanabaena sp. PCC 6802]
MTSILLISGSPSHPSKTHGLLEYANALLLQQGVKTNLIAVRNLPPEDLVFGRYNSPSLEEPKALLAEADGAIVATPIYKAAYTGVLKAFLDLLPQQALSDKVILPIATGGTIAHLLSIDFTLKPLLSELGARHILGGVYAVDKQIAWNDNNTSVQLEEEIEQRLKQAIDDLLLAVSLSPQRSSTHSSGVSSRFTQTAPAQRS